MHADTPEIPAGLETATAAFLEASLKHILRHENPSQYLEALGDIVRSTGFEQWFDADMPFWVLGRSVWNATPLPSQGFKPAPLPEPKRNDPCPCGSGKKFKRCCLNALSGHTMAVEEEMPIVHRAVSLYSRQQRHEAMKKAPPRVRLALADLELEEAHPGKARTILLALLQRDGLDATLQTHAVQLLGEAYEALGHQRAGEKAFHALLDDLGLSARSAALQWLASRRLERERPEEAMLLVMEADLYDPGNLVTGLLLVTCLRALGEDEEAQAAATEWLPVAEELGDAQAVALLKEQASLATLDDAADDSLLRSLGDLPEDEDSDDDEAFVAGPSQSQLDALTHRLEQAGREPLLPVHFDAGPPSQNGEEYFLALSPEVQRAETVLYGDMEETDPMNLALIERHPGLLQSPTFLESLDEAGQELIFHDRDAFQQALDNQQQRVIDHILSALPAGGQLPWGMLEHRPVIRHLVQQALDENDLDRAIAGFQRALALCPNDNLGVRAPLADALLRAGHDQEALALTEQYPGDHLAEIRYGRVLALVRLNRLHDAEEALKEAYQALPKVLNYLTASKRKQPKLDPSGMILGGADQAWLYRQQMRDVFAETPGMLSWLDSMKRRMLR
ncbi:SEC-C metal-binding domain-containing protein [Halomonas sp. NO4]|uniref:SEC-C metal-binding domain-containing protein n=1 Tax=Halomonas sp. NO4 TaxID=2484813 RepID=UPI0013D2981A|nr:SEC-C metal-binding domain-containing protein [Halomonas sp. NO4]